VEKIKDLSREEAKKQYEELLDELLKEPKRQISLRNNQYFDETLRLFEQAGYTKIQHSNWRDADMLWSMFTILASKHKRLNPWKYEEYTHDDDPYFDSEPQEEIYPGLDRLDLEILAADQYISKKIVVESEEEVDVAKASKDTKKVKNSQKKERKGNLAPIGTEDLVKTGLTGKEVVDDWLQKNPEELDSDGNPLDPEDLIVRLSHATSRTKIALTKKGLFTLPMRCQKIKKAQWHGYALVEEGSAGGKSTGNKYGIIRDDSGINQS
jgi:hypothetical protein